MRVLLSFAVVGSWNDTAEDSYFSTYTSSSPTVSSLKVFVLLAIRIGFTNHVEICVLPKGSTKRIVIAYHFFARMGRGIH